MKTLVFGAGPLGSVYAHLLHQAGVDVTLLARGERYDWLQRNGLALRNEMTGEEASSRVKLVERADRGDSYDLVIVLVRRNKLGPVFDTLAGGAFADCILFMGNNVRGFGEYAAHIPEEKLLFGFPGIGGGIRNHVLHYADRDKPRGKRRPVTIGAIGDRGAARTQAVKTLFEAAALPVDVTRDIDGWLKYHVALVGPLVGALYLHGCDNYRAAKDVPTRRALVRAAKEGGRVLAELGYKKRQPFQFNLFYWLPEWMSCMAVGQLLESRFAEVAFAMHAESARDEMMELAHDFRQLVAATTVDTPNLDAMTAHIFAEGQPP